MRKGHYESERYRRSHDRERRSRERRPAREWDREPIDRPEWKKEHHKNHFQPGKFQ